MDLVGGLPAWAAIALAAARGGGGELLGPPPHPPGAVPVALPLGAPQHRADGLGRRRAVCTRSTRRSPRRSPCSRSCCSATARGVFGGVAVFITLLALFQHANVRLRFPGLRWVINTPEWHHWHHAIDDRGARQELRPAGGRQDLRHRLPAEGGAAERVRHALARPRRRLPPSSRVSVLARGEGRGGDLGYGRADPRPRPERPRPSRRSKRTSRCPESRPTDRAFMRLNMISSVDGGTAVDGVSGGLGNRDDHAVFAALRAQADGCLVGLGTVLAEQYTVPDPAAAPALRGVRHQRRERCGGAVRVGPRHARGADERGPRARRRARAARR